MWRLGGFESNRFCTQDDVPYLSDHDFNDKPSSIYIDPGCSMTAFWDSNYRGSSTSYGPGAYSSLSGGWDNDISSVRCRCGKDCQVGGWSGWGACSRTCGTGTQTRTRSVTQQKWRFGADCPNLTETQNCNTFVCPVNCAVSEWGNWGSCSKSCDSGTRTRSRTVTVARQGTGADCPALTESGSCNTQLCNRDCTVGEWTSWIPAGADFRTTDATAQARVRARRTRTVLQQPIAGGVACPALEETMNCNFPCNYCSPTDANFCTSCAAGYRSSGNGQCVLISEWAQCRYYSISNPTNLTTPLGMSRGIDNSLIPVSIEANFQAFRIPDSCEADFYTGYFGQGTLWTAAASSTGRFNPTYIGCYEDGSPRDLPFLTNSISAVSDPIGTCATQCLANNRTFAGLQFGGECWCGTEPPRRPLRPDSECNMNCGGNSNVRCGGHSRNSVYQLRPRSVNCRCETCAAKCQDCKRGKPNVCTACAPGYKADTFPGNEAGAVECYLPPEPQCCFYDQADRRGQRTCFRDQNVDWVGWDFNERFKWAKVEQGCTATLHQFWRRPSSGWVETYTDTEFVDFSARNPGPRSLSCNCGNLPQVVTTTPAPNNWNKPVNGSLNYPAFSRVGCFRDNQNGVREFNLTWTRRMGGPADPPVWCSTFCFESGANLFGLQNGDECWCGANSPSVGSNVTLSECNVPCRGNDSIMCGGLDRNMVYTINQAPNATRAAQARAAAASAPVYEFDPITSSGALASGSGSSSSRLFTYLGCFFESEELPDLAEAPLERLDGSMTPAVCLQNCNGFEYFGIRQNLCVCGRATWTPRFGNADESLCQACSADPGQKCGSNRQSSVYQLFV